jgi:hypothetical protein
VGFPGDFPGAVSLGGTLSGFPVVSLEGFHVGTLGVLYGYPLWMFAGDVPCFHLGGLLGTVTWGLLGLSHEKAHGSVPWTSRLGGSPVGVPWNGSLDCSLEGPLVRFHRLVSCGGPMGTLLARYNGGIPWNNDLGSHDVFLEG